MPDLDLPDFASPPVQEVIGSVQFLPLPSLGLPEMIRVGEELDGYELDSLQPHLPPIQEVASSQPSGPVFPQLFLNTPAPQRALYRHAADGRFVVQLQNDRVAVNERRTNAEDAPSSKHVWPQLERVLAVVQKQLVEGVGYGPGSANLVELTYVNVATDVPVDRLLRALSSDYTSLAQNDVENVDVSFSFPRHEAGRFVGRVHVHAGPAVVDGTEVSQMQLVARRLVDRGADLAVIYDACHRDAVEMFTGVTEPDMHTIWGRTR